jgi:hypothetical protein
MQNIQVKKRGFFLIVCFCYLCCFGANAQVYHSTADNEQDSEQRPAPRDTITIVTYYPSPVGVYRDLKTTHLIFAPSPTFPEHPKPGTIIFTDTNSVDREGNSIMPGLWFYYNEKIKWVPLMMFAIGDEQEGGELGEELPEDTSNKVNRVYQKLKQDGQLNELIESINFQLQEMMPDENTGGR